MDPGLQGNLKIDRCANGVVFPPPSSSNGEALRHCVNYFEIIVLRGRRRSDDGYTT